jgi:hypothetical protein
MFCVIRRRSNSGGVESPMRARRWAASHGAEPKIRARASAAAPRRGRRRGLRWLFAAKVLRCDDVEVTVVDRTNHHLFQPLLYQLATGILAQGDIAPPILDILRRRDKSTCCSAR